MKTRTFTNHTNLGIPDVSIGINQGTMQYVPSFGPQGIFITMGGTARDTDSAVPLSTVYIFDPALATWHAQNTTGLAPTNRVLFCAAGVASTNGTYEMYVSLLFEKGMWLC